MLDNENTNGFETNPEENKASGEQTADSTYHAESDNTENNNRSDQNSYYNNYYSANNNSQNNAGSNDSQNYNNFNNYNNGNRDNKNKNKVPIIIAIACVTVLVGISCLMGVFAIVGKNGNSSGIKDILSNSETTKNTETYSDIGSTSTGSANTTSTSGVTVTDVSNVVSNTMPSVVAITSKTLIESSGYESIYDYYFGGGRSGNQTYEQEAAGSGIIVDQTDTELLIVTNNHVVEGADSLKIQFDGMSTEDAVDGYIKGTDANADVAVVAVKLKDIPEDTLNTIKKATLGDSDSVTVGEGVIAIGNALGYGQSVTTGIISAKDREVTIEEKTMKLLQTDAAINGGNSGGALLNAKGEVIGINVAKYSSDGSSSASVEGMGFAIPISSVKSIISNLETKETREKVSDDEKGYLGISSKYDVSEEISEAYGMPTGVYIYETISGGPADKAGIQAGDILTEFDGQAISSYDTLKSVMQYYKAGEKVKVKIAYADGREYKEKEVTVTLGTAKDAGVSTSQE